MKVGDITIIGNPEDILNIKILRINDIYESGISLIYETVIYNFLEKDPMRYSIVNDFICGN